MDPSQPGAKALDSDSPDIKTDANTPDSFDQRLLEESLASFTQEAVPPEFYSDDFANGTPIESKFQQCSTCLDSVPSQWTLTLSCHHVHCHNCLAANVKTCLSTTPFQAAKCCQAIPTRTIKMVSSLSEDELDAYDAKMGELTSPNLKLYCVGCGNLVIIGSTKKRVGECQQCGVKTCKLCRQKSHRGGCDQSKLEEAHQSEDLLFRLAKSKGWKACPNCANVVQKSGGCNHLT